MKGSASLLLSTAALLLTTAASAETRRSEVTVFAGTSFLDASTAPDSFYRARFEQPFVVGMRYGFVLSPHFTIEASYRYSPNGGWTITLKDPLFLADVSSKINEASHAVVGGLVYYLSTSEKLRPFVAGGLGAETFLLERNTETSLRGEAGFGLRFRAREGLALRLEAKYVLLSGFHVTEKNEGAAEIQFGLVVGL